MSVVCSDGGGRTGIYIAVDAVLSQLDTQRHADIFSCVVYLRSCRLNLVKTLVCCTLPFYFNPLTLTVAIWVQL